MYAKQKTTPHKPAPTGSEPPDIAQGARYPQTADHYAREAEISLIDIWRILGTHRWLVLGLMLLASLMSLAAALLMTPEYRAEVLLAPVNDLDDSQHSALAFGEFGSIAALAGVNLDRKDKKNEAIATLRSRQFTEQFIAARKLDRVVFSDLWDQEHDRWNADAGKDIPTSWDVFEVFDKDIRRVSEDRTTGLVTLSIEWKDPQQAAQWANELAANVNATLRQQAVEASNDAIAYLQDQLTRTSVVDLQQVLHRLIESEMKKIIVANINEEFAFRVIDPAVAPDEPFRPRTVVMVVVGAVAGLVLGIIAALLLNGLRAGRVSALGESHEPGKMV
jgi:uncharacterized protein involved in exopolysaccharide biosynthesis